MQPLCEVSFHRHPRLVGLETAWVEASVHAFPDHVHDHYTLCYLDTGAAWGLGPGREEGWLLPGAAALINPGQVHSGVPQTGQSISYYVFCLSRPFMERLAAETCPRVARPPRFRRLAAPRGRGNLALAHLGRLVLEGAELGAQEEALVTAVGELLADHAGMTPEGPGGSGEPRAVALAREYLAAHLHRPVSLAELAAQCDLSRHYLIRAFQKATGISPHAYHLQLRVGRAQALLRRGGDISQVALEVGFSDQSHFSHCFRRLVGATPGQYRAGGERAHVPA